MFMVVDRLSMIRCVISYESITQKKKTVDEVGDS